MNMLLLDAFFLSVAWTAGVSNDRTGPAIHLLPLLACAAVLLHWYPRPAAVKDAVKKGTGVKE